VPVFEESLAAALERHRLGLLDEARESYLDLLAARPHRPDLHNLLGLISHQRGDARDARRWIRQAIALAPTIAETWKNLVAVDPASASAIPAVRRSAALAPNDAERWFTVDEVSGDGSAVRRGLALDPQSVAGWSRKARRELERSRAQQGLVAARRSSALSQAPAHLDVHERGPAPIGSPSRIGDARFAMPDGEIAIVPYCVEMSGAVVTDDFLVISRDGTILLEGLVPEPRDPLRLTQGVFTLGDRHAIVRRGRIGRVRRAALLGGSRNYYHWLIEHLPRLALLEDDTTRRLIVNDDLAPFQIEMLAHLGITPDRLAMLPAGEWVHVEDLKVVSLLVRSSLVHPAAIAWLRRRFLPKCVRANGRLFISRRKATKRLLLDETRVAEELSARGFSIVEMEERSVVDQIALVAGAEIIVGPHGAGLANLVFASKGCRVIEIEAMGAGRSFFPALAELCGLRYERIVGVPSNPHALQDSDIRLGDTGIGRLIQSLDAVR
jgi:tetratricopeptide (TPR) repeat protein